MKEAQGTSTLDSVIEFFKSVEKLKKFKHEKQPKNKFISIDKDVIYSDKISTQAKIVYCVLIDHQDPSSYFGIVYLSLTTISTMTGLCRTSVIKYIKELEDNKIVHVFRFEVSKVFYNIYFMPKDFKNDHSPDIRRFKKVCELISKKMVGSPNFTPG